MSTTFEPALEGARAVLFLCSGNMVRSAFADLYARHLHCPVPVSSAATRFRNDHMLDETARALVARGVPAAWTRAFRPRHLSDLIDDLDASTLILGMSRQHLEALAHRPALLPRAFLLTRVAGEASEIQDPVLEDADFEHTFQRIATCVETLVESLRGRAADPGL
jgi:protein-tyrosine-phosphatase